MTSGNKRCMAHTFMAAAAVTGRSNLGLYPMLAQSCCKRSRSASVSGSLLNGGASAYGRAGARQKVSMPCTVCGRYSGAAMAQSERKPLRVCFEAGLRHKRHDSQWLGVGCRRFERMSKRGSGDKAPPPCSAWSAHGRCVGSWALHVPHLQSQTHNTKGYT